MVRIRHVTTKLLTFESWVTRWDWYQYAKAHPQHVPHLLIDRSMCQEPFFDLYAAPNERRPLISGLCRCLKNFSQGQRFLYITRIDKRVCKDLGISADGGPCYFGVAALTVERMWPSLEAVAGSFQPRQYVVAPAITWYPPNIAFSKAPDVAVSRECCTVLVGTNLKPGASVGSLANFKRKALTPLVSTDAQWRQQYAAYRQRQKAYKLRVGECHVDVVDGVQALAIDHSSAPILSPADWVEVKHNVMGIMIGNECAGHLRDRIATHCKL